MTTENALKPDTRDRAEIPEEYTWDLSHIYPDWDAWEADLGRLQELMDRYQELEGTLAEGPQRILEASRLSDELGQLAYRVYQYPGLMRSQDTRDNDVQARLEQVRLALAAFRQATAWYTPELLEIPEETMQGWLDETPELAPYRFGIEESYRMQQHVLDEDGERLLAYASTFNGTPAQTYSMMADADVKFPTVTLSDGREVVASHANYSQGLHSLRDQDDRETLFKAHFSVYDAYPNTYAAIYNGVLQKDWFTARSRRYDSALEAKLDDDNIPATVVENLIAPHGTEAVPSSATTGSASDLWARTLPLLRCLPAAGRGRVDPALRRGRPAHRRVGGDLRRRTTRRRSSAPSTSAGSTSTKTRASAPAPSRPGSTASTPTCCSTTPTPSTTPSPWPTRWATPCTPCCPTRASPSPPRTTRSLSPKSPR